MVKIYIAFCAVLLVVCWNLRLVGQQLVERSDEGAGSIRLSIAPLETAPEMTRLQPLADVGRGGSVKPVQWISGSFGYRNLMFEEPMVERYGLRKRHGAHQVRSGGAFFIRGVFLPVDMIRGAHRRLYQPDQMGQRLWFGQ